MTFHFPPTTFSQTLTLSEQDRQIESEFNEMITARDMESINREAEETMDLYHACETKLRIFERVFGASWVHDLFTRCRQKNGERGYYL